MQKERRITRGLFLVPPLVARFALSAERRRSFPTAVLAGAVAFSLAAPYALKGAERKDMGMGFTHSIGYYYGQDASARISAGAFPSLQAVGDAFALNLGPLGLALAAASIVLFRPTGTLIPAAALILASIVVIAPANLVSARHVLRRSLRS